MRKFKIVLTAIACFGLFVAVSLIEDSQATAKEYVAALSLIIMASVIVIVAFNIKDIISLINKDYGTKN